MNPRTHLKRAFASIVLVFFFVSTVLAQIPGGDTKPPVPTGDVTLPNSSGFSGTGANIDVKYYRCNWRINPDSVSKGIKGHVVTYFVTTAASVTSVSFDINSVLVIDSVRFRGAKLPAGNTARAGNVATITLGATLSLGTLDSIFIYYKGVPPAINGQAEGYQKKASGANNYIYTLSESYEDRDWWPCKADMMDKPDSMDFVFSVPNTFWVACNGRLVDSTISGANRTFIFKHRYPIATYLVAICVAKFNTYYRGTVNVGGTNVPVVYNIFQGKTAGTYTSILNALDKSILELTAFSNVFGDYPFKNDKHGFYEFGWGGGMEHQGFSAMGSGVLTNWSVIAHELAHQWFGDKVTFATWNELWLAEGFAKYCESLAAELVPSLGQNPVTLRGVVKGDAISQSTFSVYVPNSNITNSNTLWASTYGSSVYDRGAMVVSMLRKLVGDTKFYQALQNYLNDPLLAYKSATTTDLKNHFVAVCGGYNLDAFFTDWVYGTGNPTYTIHWGTNAITKKINIQVTGQTQSASSTVPYFRSPIVLRIRDAGAGDTTVVIYDQNGSLSKAGNGIQPAVSGNLLTYKLSFVPTTVTIDPFNETMVTSGTAIQLSTLAVDLIGFTGKHQSNYNSIHLELAANQQIKQLVLQKSIDGISFFDAGDFAQSSENGISTNFIYKDFAYYPGATFYRAKILELDGNLSFSPIIKIVDEWKGKNVKVSPNPANEKTLVRWSNDGGKLMELRIINTMGQQIFQKKSNRSYMEISTASFEKGIYVVQVIAENEIIATEQLVIQR